MEIVKRRIRVNPGRKKRKRNKMSLAQLLHFGTKRQRAGAAARLKNSRKRKRRNAGKFSIRKTKKALKKDFGYKFVSPLGRKSGYRKRTRKRNVGSIVSVLPANPGRKRRKKRYVARRKNRSVKRVVVINKGEKRVARRKRVRRVNRAHRRRRNPVYRGRIKRGLYKYSSNPGRRRRRARRNPGVRRYHRRRNPGVLSGTSGSVLGVLGGVATTKLLSGFLPSMFASGPMNYIGIGAIAFLQGKVVAKFTKNAQLGHNMMIGGLAYLTAKILSDFFPSFGSSLGFGLIGPSSFFTPQVNMPGNMGAFVQPSSQARAIAAASMPAVAANRGVAGIRRGRIM